MDQALLNAKVADAWNTTAARPEPRLKRWWHWPQIVSYTNQSICGERLPGWGAGLLRELDILHPNRVFRRGISIGCGAGQKEMGLMTSGRVEQFELFELSDVRIEAGKAAFAAAGLSDRVRWHTEDGIAAMWASRGQYDLVHWDNSLHHMFNVADAISASRYCLCDGGVFLMLDYVGSTRMQWTERELSYANAIRATLPARFFIHPTNPTWVVPKKISRIDVETLMNSDPSEMADSGNIIPNLRENFINPRIWNLGGVVFHLALSDLLQNFDIKEDSGLLELMLITDQALAESGLTHYGACIATR